MAHRGKLAVWAMFLYSKQQKSYQGTLGTLELTPIGSRASLGPSMDPTGRPAKRSEPFWEQELRAEILLPARDPQFQGSLIGICPLTIVDIVLPLWMLLTPSLLVFLSLKIIQSIFDFLLLSTILQVKKNP